MSGLELLRCEELLGTCNANVVLPRCINHYSPDDFDNLNKRDRDVMRCLMVLRTLVRMEDMLGGGKVPLMPVNHCGFVSIKRSIPGVYIHRADKETLRRWHNLAADWCTDRCDDVRERLYHLITCGCLREVSKPTWAHRHEIMDSPDEDAIKLLADTPGDGITVIQHHGCFSAWGGPRRPVER